jgi:hypothetical protein
MQIMTLSAKSRLFAALLLSGCFLTGGCSGSGSGDVYPIPLAEAKAKVAGTKASYQAGSKTRSMRATPSADGLRVKMPSMGTFTSACTLRFEAVSESSTRVTPDCGTTGAATTDAIARFAELEIDALVRQTLTGEPVDADALGREMVEVMKQNVAQMQAEGFAPDEEWVRQQKEAAIQRAEDEKAGWAE